MPSKGRGPNLFGNLARAFFWSTVAKGAVRSAGKVARGVANAARMASGREPLRSVPSDARTRFTFLSQRHQNELTKRMIAEKGRWIEFNKEGEAVGTMKERARRKSRAEEPIMTAAEEAIKLVGELLRDPHVNFFERAKSIKEAEEILFNLITAVRNPMALREFIRRRGFSYANVEYAFKSIVDQIVNELGKTHSQELKALFAQALGEIAASEAPGSVYAKQRLNEIILKYQTAKLREKARIMMTYGAAAMNIMNEIQQEIMQRDMQAQMGAMVSQPA